MYAFRIKDDPCKHYLCMWSIYPAMMGRADSGVIKFDSYQEAHNWFDTRSDTLKKKLGHYHIVKM